MPVITASRLKRYIVNRNLFCRYRRQITLPHKILRKSVIAFTVWEKDAVLVLLFFRHCRFFLPDILRQAEYRPTLRPADIHRRMGNDGGDFLPAHSMIFCIFQMIDKGRIRNAGCHQGYYRNDTFCFHGNRILIPYLSKKHIII